MSQHVTRQKAAGSFSSVLPRSPYVYQSHDLSAGLSAVLPVRGNQSGTGGVGEWNGGRVQEELGAGGVS